MSVTCELPNEGATPTIMRAILLISWFIDPTVVNLTALKHALLLVHTKYEYVIFGMSWCGQDVNHDIADLTALIVSFCLNCWIKPVWWSKYLPAPCWPWPYITKYICRKNKIWLDGFVPTSQSEDMMGCGFVNAKAAVSQPSLNTDIDP